VFGPFGCPWAMLNALLGISTLWLHADRRNAYRRTGFAATADGEFRSLHAQTVLVPPAPGSFVALVHVQARLDGLAGACHRPARVLQHLDQTCRVAVVRRRGGHRGEQ